MEAPLLIVTSSTKLSSRSRPNILRPSDSHQFLIPNLAVSSTSVNSILKANSDDDMQSQKSGYSLCVPNQHSRCLRNRPSVTSENVITGMKLSENGKGWVRRESTAITPFFDCRSNTFSSDDRKERRRAKGLTLKEIKRLALYEQVGDTYDHIVGKNVGVSLTPYGFPVLEDSPRDFTDESKFHSFRNDPKSPSMIENHNPFHPYIASTTTSLSSEGKNPVIDVTVTYDKMGMIKLSAMKLNGIKDKRRVLVSADLASHKRKKRVIGPMVSVKGNCEYKKDVAFFRAQQSHFELSQLKLTVHTDKHRLGHRTLLGSTTISLRDLAVGQTTYSRPLCPSLPRKDLGRLRLVLCYHAQKRRLLVTVVRATNLPSKILLPSDSYVVIELRGSDGNLLSREQTKEKRFSNNPVYKEAFSFDLPPCSMEDWDFTDIQHPLDDVTLTITVQRKKLFFCDDVIGRVTLRSEMRTNGYSHLWKCKRASYQPITEWHDLKSLANV